jgi:hypothetical protein
MNFAKKATASVLAVSTVMWAAAFMYVMPVSAAAHGEGCLVNLSGTVYKIMGGQRRGFTSAEVFMSHGYNFGQVVAGNSDDSALPVGSIQIYANGTLVKGPSDPLVYLVVNGQKRGFTSGAVFTGLGYSFANIQWAPVNTFNDIPTGANIDSTSISGLPMSGPGPQSVSCGTTSTPGGSCGSLAGNAGDITVSQTSDFSAEEVGEGEEEVGVLSFEIEADDESDVKVTSVKVELKQTNSADSQDIEDYVDEVQVMMGNDVVGTADPDSFNETSDVYTKTISLDCAVVQAGETEEFSINLSAINSFDSADIDSETFGVELMSVRFTDADGVTSTESISADSIDETANFVDFATAAEVELAVSLTEDEEDTNESHNIIVDEDEATDDVELLAFSLEAEGDSDIWVDEVPVLITTNDSDLDTVISSADLYHGTTLVDSQSVTTSSTSAATVTFEDLDLTVDAGDTEDFTVKVNVRAADSSNFAEGATIKAEITSTQTDLIEAEDEEGEDVSASDLTGTALGEAHSLFANGVTVEVNSAETDITVNDSATDDGVTFTWDITVTNVGDDDVYINADVADIVSSSSATDVDTVYAVEDGSATLTSLSGTISDTSNATEVTGSTGDFASEVFYKISAGSSEDFTIVVTATNSVAAAQVRAMLTDIEWTTDVTGSTEQSYTATLSDDSTTPYKLAN